ncbi:uncharacterized protein LOC123709394 [Pieris brassicae]|uniref:Uncharacterized protein n=1 Tax=Pieris brassicae TaxID=7116 RepID=A0A9P0X9K7_PIEBR|nr:uncharacterized protein LOC123709394 [Pieris brassicae]XP_045516655.1 uncharacterized protein LOC123709394 [Pieris brassicae]CAH4027800.1 unnamed protein product [Pieris brassicae]
MGQEQSLAQASVAPVRHYQDNYANRIHRASSVDLPTDYHKDYRKLRRSTDSYKSDNSSTESSGYRSGSSAYDRRSDRSSKSNYYCIPLYKNDHYKEINKELYRQVKIPKDKRHKLQPFHDNEIKTERIKSYLSDTEKAKAKPAPTPKKAGIRNYTPKIISAEEETKKVDSWI